jgi:hypothetical protein
MNYAKESQCPMYGNVDARYDSIGAQSQETLKDMVPTMDQALVWASFHN